MMYAQTAIIGLIVCGVGFAQQSAPRPLPYPPNGKLVAEGHPVRTAASLSQLITMADLIVDGTVISVLPAVSLYQDPDVPLVETHSIVAVSAMLKGAVPNASTTILLSQSGGKAGRWDVTVAGDSLVSQGERYIFFLALDKRKEPPNTSGMPRYVDAGAWCGKVKVIGWKIQFPPRAHAELHKYDNTDVNAFLQTVKDILNNAVMPPPRPIHPTPPTQRQRP